MDFFVEFFKKLEFSQQGSICGKNFERKEQLIFLIFLN